MPQGVIEPVGEDILCSIVGGEREARFSAVEAEAKLRQWAKRYDAATRVDNEGELSAIGLEAPLLASAYRRLAPSWRTWTDTFSISAPYEPEPQAPIS